MAKKNPPTVSRVLPLGGPTKVSWALRMNTSYTPFEKLARYHLSTMYLWPACRAFYTPYRHQATNIDDCLRQFDNVVRYTQVIHERYSPVSTKNSGTASVRWINYRLDDDDKDVLQAEPLALDAMLDDFMDLIFHGYRLSVSYDDYSKAMQASLVCVDTDNPDVGLGMSSRHPDLTVALRSLLYKGNKVGWRKWHTFSAPPQSSSWS